MMSKKAMLYDATRCTACRGCQVACKQWNDRAGWNYSHTKNTGSYQNPPNLTPQTWTLISFQEYENKDNLEWLFLKRGCFHCTDAGCVQVCPTQALSHDPDSGIVTLRPELCNGCGYCTQFCPFEIPKLQTDVVTGEGTAFKCNFCQDRLSNGDLPACVQTCTAGALSFGDRDAMVALGESRVEAAKARFPNANLYGASILGGLGQMYVLAEAPSVYGLPENPTVDTGRFWQDIAQPIAQYLPVAGLAGAALAWIIARRNIRQEEVE